MGVGSCAPRHAGAMKALAVAASLLLTANAAPVWAGTPGGRPLPPIDPGACVGAWGRHCLRPRQRKASTAPTHCLARADPKRCERGFTGNTIGQVSDRRERGAEIAAPASRHDHVQRCSQRFFNGRRPTPCLTASWTCASATTWCVALRPPFSRQQHCAAPAPGPQHNAHCRRLEQRTSGERERERR